MFGALSFFGLASPLQCYKKKERERERERGTQGRPKVTSTNRGLLSLYGHVVCTSTSVGMTHCRAHNREAHPLLLMHLTSQSLHSFAQMGVLEPGNYVAFLRYHML